MRTMPIKIITPYMLKPGFHDRRGKSLWIVESCEFCNKPGSIFNGKWVSKMRAPTEKERIVSDVMQT
jgi:hypothetical protein